MPLPVESAIARWAEALRKEVQELAFWALPARVTSFPVEGRRVEHGSVQIREFATVDSAGGQDLVPGKFRPAAVQPTPVAFN